MKQYFNLLFLSVIALISCNNEPQICVNSNMEEYIEFDVVNEDLDSLIGLFIEGRCINPFENKAVRVRVYSPHFDTLEISIKEVDQMVDLWHCHLLMLKKDVLVGIEYMNLRRFFKGNILSSELMKYGFPKAYERFKNNNGEFNFILNEQAKRDFWTATFVKKESLFYMKITDVSKESE